MKKLLKVLCIVIIILAVLFCIRCCYLSIVGHKPICPLCRKSHVIHDYYSAAGIDPRVANNDINVTKEIYGEPNYVEKELVLGSKTLYWVFLHYDGFSILFQTEDFEQYDYCGFELDSPKMKIRWDIHVGSTRKQIIHAYRECPSINWWRVNGDKKGDRVCDTGVRDSWRNALVFTYDENDIVTCIRYLPNF